jgi:ATP-dependent RNA helicase DDX21
LDFPDVELVIQVEPPKQIESYIHRAGRTGRAGKTGTSVVFVQKRDMNRLKPIEKEAGFRFEEIDADSLN